MKRLFLLLLLTGVLFADYYVSTFQVEPKMVESGEFGQLKVIVVNQDVSNSLDSLSLQISWPSYLEGPTQVSLGDVSPSGTIEYNVPFKVKEGFKSGIYSVNGNFFGIVVEGNSRNVKKVSQSAVVKLLNPPAFQIGLDGSNEVKEVGDVTLRIINNGDIARKVYVSVGDGFGFADVDRIYLPEVNGEVKVNVRLDSRAVNEGPQKLPLHLEYEDVLGNEYSEDRLIPVIVRKESGDFIFTQETPVITGVEDNLKIQIKNEGNDVSDLRFSIIDEDMNMVGLSEFRVGNLKSGEIKEIEVPVIAEGKPGSVPVRIFLKWVENNEEMEGIKEIPIKIKSDVDVGVYLEGKPLPLRAGSEHTITVTVSNKGSYPIEAVSVYFNSSVLNLLNLQPEQYIGGLNQDDFSSVQYKVKVSDVPSGDYTVDLVVHYRDSSGEWMEKKVSKLVRVYEKEEVEAGLPYWALIIVLIFGGLIYWKFYSKK